jgi:hypothetical protein
VSLGFTFTFGFGRPLLRKSFYGRTRKAVQDQLTKANRDQQLGLPIAFERQTVGHFLADWLKNTVRSRVRPKTLASYEQLTVNHIVPAIGKSELSKITAQDVQALLNALMQKGLSPRTVQYVRAVLRLALNQAVVRSMAST